MTTSDAKDEPTPQERREAFGRALGAVLASKDHINQKQLAESLGVSQAMISDWKTGTKEPRPVMVFAMERALNLEPGYLSIHLGYLPPEAAGTLESALLADSTLSDRWRNVLLEMMRTIQRERRDAGRNK